MRAETKANLEIFGITLLRIGVGLLFMQHGVRKHLGLLGGFGGSGGTAPFPSKFFFAGIFEFYGGLLIVLGLLTRPVAILLALEMLVAFSTVHLPGGGFPIQNGGELPLLYALSWIFFATHGAGPVSLDHALFGRRRGRRRDEENAGRAVVDRS